MSSAPSGATSGHHDLAKTLRPVRSWETDGRCIRRRRRAAADSAAELAVMWRACRLEPSSLPRIPEAVTTATFQRARTRASVQDLLPRESWGERRTQTRSRAYPTSTPSEKEYAGVLRASLPPSRSSWRRQCFRFRAKRATDGDHRKILSACLAPAGRAHHFLSKNLELPAMDMDTRARARASARQPHTQR